MPALLLQNEVKRRNLSLLSKSVILEAITGGHLCLGNDHILLSLPVRCGGLAIPLFHNDRNTNMKTLENQHRQ